MRIGLISEHASPLAVAGGVDSGGQNVYVAQVARHVASLGHTVDVFTRRDAAGLPGVVPFCQGVRVVHLDAGPPRFVPKEKLLPHIPGFTQELLGFARRSRGYDLLHANFFMSGLAAAEIKRRTGTPFVITFHALGRVRLLHQASADRFPPERLEIEDRIAREADRVIAECPQDRDDLLRHYGADPRSISVVPCGFDPREFRPEDRRAARARLGLEPAAPLLLQLGRLVPRKGIDTVIQALGRLAGTGLPARLLVVGGDSDVPDAGATPELARLRAVARKEGVQDRVQFTGRRGRETLRWYYSAADVFVTTPWYEPFGITPLEAMACGTPVIGARVGGIQYTVVHGRTGLLVPPRDPEAVAASARELLTRPSLRARLGRAGLARVRARFTWRRVARALERIYAVAAARRPAAAAGSGP
ncbi:MAG TPA: glycosyltransferase family 1 protein [Candidatus Polarisedimenticolia bacterium]|nr:glycosyltransferase family 1 protein [Candidatus Polarisedimenticolia bacterium]